MDHHNLNEAAQEGDINALYAAITADPTILDKLDAVPFCDTPLHIAARLGNTHFALEVMTLKPSLATKLNQNGYSPMHLASLYNHQQLVRGLLLYNRDLVRVNGREGRTPLHSMAAAGGNSSILYEMLFACPDSLTDLTARRETALHLAVKQNQYEAFDVLVECVKRFHKENQVYRCRDEDGNTVLHLATRGNQIEMTQLLFEKYRCKEWNLGIEVEDKRGGRAKNITGNLGFFQPRVADISKWLTYRYWSYMMHLVSVGVSEMSPESRVAFLLVVGLVNTTSFQAGMNPPGGFWQDEVTPILSTTNPVLFKVISFCTMSGFFTSLNLILILTIRMPMRYILLVTMIYLSYSTLVAYTAIIAGPSAEVILGTYIGVAVWLLVSNGLITAIYLWKYLLIRIEKVVLKRQFYSKKKK